ncbi:MAG TPA: YojF family protein [Symbiobacteriaceae bacterium]|nr:YojF family protein [Symbiobacteriaceae bacterium]
MKPIQVKSVQDALQAFVNRDVYLHIETTTGAYAAMVVCAYVRNAVIRFSRATIAGTGPYRVGLQMDHGWTYAEGLTDWTLDEQGRLLLAGHDADGRLAVSLQLSLTPFHV